MRRNSSAFGNGPSRIRFVLLDAELADGNIEQITQAIHNALKPATGVQQRAAISSPTKAIAHEPPEHGDATGEEIHDEMVEVNETSEPRQPRLRRTVSRTPKVVPIEMNEGVSLASFAQRKDSRSQHKKFLIAAAWLKEHRGIDAVTDGHIYTCFKSVGWSTNIPDFSQPLRDLKAKQQYFEKSDKGYEINHLGLDYVKKLGGGNGTD
jgi:hypothetical protein